MYIKLGTLRLAYHQEYDDWMIMAEIIDSSMSYERPILVRSTDELDVWFGKDFSDYDYLTDFLNAGLTLFLYKPVETETTGGSDYIDLSEYQIIGDPNEEDYLTESETPWIITFLNNPERYKFHSEVNDVWFTISDGHLIENEGEIIGREYCTDEFIRDRLKDSFLDLLYSTEKPEFYVLDAGNKYLCIFTKEGEQYLGIVNINLLPQNLEKTSTSFDNRDTLLLGTQGSKIQYSYADYKTGETDLGIYKGEEEYLDEMDPIIGEIDQSLLEKVSDNLQSAVFIFNKSVMKTGDYFIFPQSNINRDWTLLYCGDEGLEKFESTLDEETIEHLVGNRKWEVVSDDSEDFKGTLEDLGLKIIQEDESLVTFSSNLLPVLNYQDCSELIIVPETDLTFKKLSQQLFDGTVNISNIKTTGVTLNEGEEYKICISINNKLVEEVFTAELGYGLSINDGNDDILLCYTCDQNNNIILKATEVSNVIYLRENLICFEFWSKTIGRGSKYKDEDYIEVQVEESNSPNNYRFTISRYSYSETFEGPIEISDPGNETRIDNTISKESKLVYCKYLGGTVKPGTYRLQGATIEDTNDQMYLYSLNTMFSEDVDSVYPDFFLVPDKYKFLNHESDETELERFESRIKKVSRKNKNGEIVEIVETNEYLYSDESPIPKITNDEQLSDYLDYRYNYTTEIPTPDHIVVKDDEFEKIEYLRIRYYNCHVSNFEEVYNKFLEYAKIGDFQFLLENDEVDYKYNIDDPENRILYFYNNFYLYNKTRPGYFLFVNGIIDGEFSASMKYLNYNCPPKDENEDEYGYSTLENNLSDKKSNFLISNNQYYYYEKFQNGKSYTTTGLMRFIAGKISRELQKKKWDYLGQQLTGKIRSIITDILLGIEKGFTMVKSIQMTDFEMEPQKNLLRIELNTYTYDLVDNNIKLNITLDYNNINKDFN